LIGVGLEVEEVEDKTKLLAAFTVGYVKEAIKHPNADKLRLCKVETFQGEIQVVCGAPNARAGMKGIVALPGAYIPGTGITLEKGVIRGSESQGMLCSERELMISDEHTASSTSEATGRLERLRSRHSASTIDDLVKVTPNRPDRAGSSRHRARSRAKGLGKLKPLDAKAVPGTFESPIKVTLDFPENDTMPARFSSGATFAVSGTGPLPNG